jgi:hypothetical protein
LADEASRGDRDENHPQTAPLRAVAIPFTKLELVGGFAPEAIVAIEHNDGVAIVTCGQSRYRIPAFEAQDFPPALSAGPDAAEIALSTGDVHRLFVVPGFAISTEETRFYLTGAGDWLRVVATNAHTLILMASAISVPLIGATVIRSLRSPFVTISENRCPEIVRSYANEAANHGNERVRTCVRPLMEAWKPFVTDELMPAVYQLCHMGAEHNAMAIARAVADDERYSEFCEAEMFVLLVAMIDPILDAMREIEGLSDRTIPGMMRNGQSLTNIRHTAG